MIHRMQDIAKHCVHLIKQQLRIDFGINNLWMSGNEGVSVFLRFKPVSLRLVFART